MDIQINTGAREFNLGGKVSVWFNPTDTTFLERMRDVFLQMQSKQEDIARRIADAEDVYEESRKIDAEMREALERVFGVDVVTPLIGDMNVYALADGLPIWAQILISTMDVIQKTVEEERNKSVQKIKEYTEKYD